MAMSEKAKKHVARRHRLSQKRMYEALKDGAIPRASLQMQLMLAANEVLEQDGDPVELQERVEWLEEHGHPIAASRIETLLQEISKME